jgi:hypothetical protein
VRKSLHVLSPLAEKGRNAEPPFFVQRPECETRRQIGRCESELAADSGLRNATGPKTLPASAPRHVRGRELVADRTHKPAGDAWRTVPQTRLDPLCQTSTSIARPSSSWSGGGWTWVRDYSQEAQAKRLPINERASTYCNVAGGGKVPEKRKVRAQTCPESR